MQFDMYHYFICLIQNSQNDIFEFIWCHLEDFGNTSPIVSECAKIVPSHLVHCLSAV